VKYVQLAIVLPFMLALALAAHALLARAVKAVLWSWSPLASGESEAVAYERRVYHTADRPMMRIAGAAALAGLPWWIAIATGARSGWAAGLLAVIAVVAWDVLQWERVAVSAHYLWFQRGFRHPVHQVAMENIRDASVEESDAGGFTLRHGRSNRLVRLQVRMKDRRVVALPKTDAHGGLDAVEAMANYLRMRLQQLRDRTPERVRRARHDLDVASVPDGAAPGPAAEHDDEMQRALDRLRRGASLKRAAP
jgi:hypothetical protein